MKTHLRLSILSMAFLCSIAPATFAQTAEATQPPAVAMVPNSFADLASHVQNAVVNISTTQKLSKSVMGLQGQGQIVPMPEFPPGSPFQDLFNDFFNGPMGQNPNMDGPGANQRVQSLGSGFVLDGAKGIIVTNNHVIDEAEEIQVILHDDTKLKAKVIGRDTETDLALLKVITSKPLKSVTWGNSDTMRVGDWILAVGNPFGLGGTVTSGIISARQRNINAGRYDDFIQTDASINRGNSGGPMFNMRGEVIGINTAIFSPSGGSVGIGFAIPSNLAKPVINQLMEFGVTKRGWIGVSIQDVTPEIADSMGLKSTKGAMVASMTPGGPAEKAGLKQGDIILSFEGKEITEMRFLPRMVADTAIGKTSALKVWRHANGVGKELDLTITTGQLETAKAKGLLSDPNAPEKAEQPPLNDTNISELNIHVAPLTPELRQRWQLNADVTGVVVTDVNRDSDAAEKGVMPGDVILEVNQKSVESPQQVADAAKAAKAEKKTSVLLLVNSQNNLRFVAVKLAE